MCYIGLPGPLQKVVRVHTPMLRCIWALEVDESLESEKMGAGQRIVHFLWKEVAVAPLTLGEGEIAHVEYLEEPMYRRLLPKETVGCPVTWLNFISFNVIGMCDVGVIDYSFDSDCNVFASSMPRRFDGNSEPLGDLSERRSGGTDYDTTIIETGSVDRVLILV